MPPLSPVESQGDSPSLHFWWKIRWSEKPPADSQLDGKDRRRKGQKTNRKKKPFPTKMTTDGSCGSLWHLLLMDGCLQPFCALDPAITHRPGKPGLVHAQHQQMGGTDRVGHPARPPLPRPLLPATSASLGGPLAVPTDNVCQRQEAGGGQTARWAEEAHGSRPALALLGTDMPYRYFGTPGRVLRPASISALWPHFLADLIWKDTSLYAICPHPTPA